MTEAAGDARPLAGRCVLVTRPRAQARELVERLEAAGAQVLVAPTIRIVPPEDRAPLLRAAADIPQFDWIVFSSANAVDTFLGALAEVSADCPPSTPGRDDSRKRDPHGGDSHGGDSHGGDSRGGDSRGDDSRRGGPSGPPDTPLAGVKVCAVGSKTADRLAAGGVAVDLVPGEFRAEAVVAALTAAGPLAGIRILLPRADIGRDLIASGLRAAGATVVDVVAYRTVAEEPDPQAPDVRQLLLDRRIDAVTFTSGSAVRSFVQMYGDDAAVLLRQMIVAVIGPVTADAARDLGIRVDVQPATYTTAAMLEALVAHFTQR